MRLLKLFLVAVFVALPMVLLLPACPGGPPDPEPTPPPPPPADTSLLLRRDGVTFVRHSDGTPFPLQVATSCCRGGYGWPLADSSWLSRIAQSGFTGVHVRPGPFLAATEPQWPQGPYREVAGQAVLGEWDPAFWDAQLEMMKQAESLGIIVEVDLIDGWRCKRSDVASPWDPQWNTSGLDARTPCSETLVETHRAWIRQVIWVYGRFMNVIWQDGNEIGLVRRADGLLVADPQYNPEWTESLRSLVLEFEAEFSYPVHLFGTNAPAAYGGSSDYVTAHRRTAAAPMLGKPTRVNEYNPALPPAQLRHEVCQAQAMGSYFDYWRSGHSEEEMEETWRLIQEGCWQPTPPPQGCSLPTPTATEALAQGLRPRFKTKTYGRGLETTPFASFGVDYCREAGWTDGRGACSVTPPGHPQQRACEAHFIGAPCPTWNGVCAEPATPKTCPITFDTLIGDDPHPINAAAGCPSPHPNHQQTPEVFWARPEGRGWVSVCDATGNVCSRYGQIVDQVVDQ